MRRNALFVLSLTLSLVAACAKQESHDHGATSATETAAAQTTAAAQREAGPVVTFPSLGGEGSGYLAVPTTEGKKPALIVIQEWWGVDNWIREQADRFSQQGYVSLAVDLYRGKSTSDPGEAHELMRALPEDRAMADLKAAYEYLASRPDVDPQRIGAIGWCMGGGYSLALATAEPRLKATVMNYGRLVTDPATIGKIQSPILGNFGAKDRGIPVEDVRMFDSALKSAGKETDIKIYEGAGHGFINPNNKDGYNAEAAVDAQQRIDRFFAEKLRVNIPNS